MNPSITHDDNVDIESFDPSVYVIGVVFLMIHVLELGCGIYMLHSDSCNNILVLTPSIFLIGSGSSTLLCMVLLTIIGCIMKTRFYSHITDRLLSVVFGFCAFIVITWMSLGVWTLTNNIDGCISQLLSAFIYVSILIKLVLFAFVIFARNLPE